MEMRHKYTLEQIQFLKDNIHGKSYAYIHTLFNQYFNVSIKKFQIIGTLKRHGLQNGINSQFKVGLPPHNKGLKGFNAGNSTRFKAGNIPTNHRSIGSEKIDVYGYLRVKIAEPKTWKLKHVLVWEQENGRIPKGYVVIFADGNKNNFIADNLLLVSRRELMVMNSRNLITPDKELTKAGRTVAGIRLKITELRTVSDGIENKREGKE